MAKLTAPLLGFDALGSIAKETTYSKWKGQNYAKRHRAPANPRTVPQVLARDTLSNANQLWRQAPGLFKATWDALAAGRPLTGYNAWIGRYIEDNLGQANLALLIFATQVLGGLPVASGGITPISQGIVVTLAPPTLPAGWTTQAGIAAVTRDGDPANLPEHLITAGEDLAAPYSVTLAGLTPGVLYRVAGWFRYTLPSGRTAYGVSTAASPAVPLP